MARRSADDPDRAFACPHCGEPARRRDSACRHCGSDASTGWSDADDDVTVGLPEAMSDADYDEFVARDPELAAGASGRGGVSDALLRRRRRALLAIVLAVLLAFGSGIVALL
jgi:hypothetical protein